MHRFHPQGIAVLVLVGIFSWVVFAEDGERLESLEDLIGRYEVDRNALARFYGWQVLSDAHRERMEKFVDAWQTSLEAVEFEKLPQDDRIDFLLMRHRLDYAEKSLATDWRKLAEIAELVSFKDGVQALYEAYRAREKNDPREVAERLAAIAKQVEALTGKVSIKEDEGTLVTTPVLALRAQKVAGEVERRLDAWYRFYSGFDPEFSWWAEPAHVPVSTRSE